MTVMAPAAPPTSKLADSTMGPFEVLAQSLAGIAPSAVMATGPALVAIGAGNAVLYSYLVSTVILLLVGWCIKEFAKRSGNDATLLSYVKSALGPAVAYLGAVGLTFGYALIAMGSMAGFALYSSSLLHAAGVSNADGKTVTILLYALCATAGAYAMIRGVQLSTRIGVVLEIVSITAILVVIIAVLAKDGLSSAPLHPAGLGISGVTGGMVLAILGFVGFESAACMGVEAKDPDRTIPRAVIGSIVIAAVLYLLSSYSQLVGFGTGAKITASAAPFNDLADAAHLHALGSFIDFGAAASFFACVTGSINAAARLLFSLAEEGFVHRAVGNAHPIRRTPHLAIIALSIISFAVTTVMTLIGVTTLNVFAYLATIGTYGYMVAYIMIAVGAPVFLYRAKASTFVTSIVIGGLAAVGMGYVFFKNVYPVPAAPYDRLPWIFLAVLFVAAAWYLVKRLGSNPAVSSTEVKGKVAA